MAAEKAQFDSSTLEKGDSAGGKSEKSKSDGNNSFLRAARNGNLEKVLEYLKGNVDINTSNANGLNALHLASKEGHINIVTELLHRGSKVDSATKKGNTALHIASLAGQEEIVKILVQNGAKVNIQSQNGFTPLYMAAQENHSEVVKYLIENGANQALSTEDGFSPLAVALQQGHDKVVAVLLENDSRSKVKLPALHIAAKKDDVKAASLLLQNEHNTDAVSKGGSLVNDTTKSGFTPLHIACHYGNYNVGSLLVEKGADVNYKARNLITPLHVSSKWGRTTMVVLLVDNRAVIDCKTRDGLTPLHCAARSGHDPVVDTLLEKGAPVGSKTKNGLSPLHMAAQGDHVDCARLLLYHKAPIDDVTVDYLTPLHVAAHCGNVRTAKLLLDMKCEVNARALNGFTPLHIACKKNRIKVVELLLKYSGSIEATTESGLTPLHVASFMGHMNIVIFLIQHGANPDTPTVRGETALHLAARANQTDIIRILLRNQASVDAKAREQQTPLHIAARLGNVDNVELLLQHGASPDATTKDLYTPLHIAAKEGHEEVAAALLEHGANHNLTTKKGFTPLHIASKYGHVKTARLLLQKQADPNVQGKNGLTPLHVATHYNHPAVAHLLLEHKADVHRTAKNGYTPLHIAAKKNQMDIATTLLEYGAKPNAESKNGFTPLHLASQEGHTDMVSLLLENGANVNCTAKNGLTPMHLAAQEDRVPVAEILVKHHAEIDPPTKAGYTPLHTACHFGQINMIHFLLEHGASVDATTKLGYTPLHQAAQQGHVLVINLLLKYKADPNAMTSTGQTPLSIAQRLGYISVVEILKTITEVEPAAYGDEKYKHVSPETMQEALMTDSEDEGAGEDTLMGDQSYAYLTTDELKILQDDSISPTKDDRDLRYFDRMGSSVSGHDDSRHFNYEMDTPVFDPVQESLQEQKFQGSSYAVPLAAAVAPVAYASKTSTLTDDSGGYPSYPMAGQAVVNNLGDSYSGASFASSFDPDNVAVDRQPIYSGFLVSFMVDARGGAMRGCRHSGVRIIVPPRKATMPTRVTCKLVKREKLTHPPPLLEGEALASRILEMGPVGAKFQGPVIIEVPHFASLRGREREVVVMRSDNGETWYEHPVTASEDAIHAALNGSFEDLESAEDLYHRRISRIITSDFPHYFALVTRIRQETNVIGPEGGMLSSTVVPQVQAVFPEGSLTKKIKVGLQAQPIQPESVSKMFGNRVAVSPIVTVEPRRRKFHKPITLTIPVPKAAQQGMINQYGKETPTLRLLCSITGGTSPSQWEDVTGTTPLTFVNDCVSFTTSVSARFWLMDCQNIKESERMATELYREAIAVPFMSKFVVFAKRQDPQESRLRVFCMTDDKMEKTLENQEHFTEIARSKDVEVLEGKPQYVEMAGNLVPVTKSGDQLYVNFHAFRENRLPFTIRTKDPNQEPVGRIAFMKDPRVGRGDAPQTPICNLNLSIPAVTKEEPYAGDVARLENLPYRTYRSGQPEEGQFRKAELRLTDIADAVGEDWEDLAIQLGLTPEDIAMIRDKYDTPEEQARMMLLLWRDRKGDRASGNELERGLKKIGHEDIIQRVIYNMSDVTDEREKDLAIELTEPADYNDYRSGQGPMRDQHLQREMSLDVHYDEQDIIKDSESIGDSVPSEPGTFRDRRIVQQAVDEPVLSTKRAATEEWMPSDDQKYVESSPQKGFPDARDISSVPSEVVGVPYGEVIESDRPTVRIYTDTIEGEPQIETDVQEFEETLPDGSVVKRKVIKTSQKQTVVKRVIMEGPEDDLPTTEEQAQLMINMHDPNALKIYPDERDDGEPDIHMDVQEYDETLPDGTVVKKRIVTRTEQQVLTEKTVLEGPDDIPDDEHDRSQAKSGKHEGVYSAGDDRDGVSPMRTIPEQGRTTGATFDEADRSFKYEKSVEDASTKIEEDGISGHSLSPEVQWPQRFGGLMAPEIHIQQASPIPRSMLEECDESFIPQQVPRGSAIEDTSEEVTGNFQEKYDMEGDFQMETGVMQSSSEMTDSCDTSEGKRPLSPTDYLLEVETDEANDAEIAIHTSSYQVSSEQSAVADASLEQPPSPTDFTLLTESQELSTVQTDGSSILHDSASGVTQADQHDGDLYPLQVTDVEEAHSETFESSYSSNNTTTQSSETTFSQIGDLANISAYSLSYEHSVEEQQSFPENVPSGVPEPDEFHDSNNVGYPSGPYEADYNVDDKPSGVPDPCEIPVPDPCEFHDTGYVYESASDYPADVESSDIKGQCDSHHASKIESSVSVKKFEVASDGTLQDSQLIETNDESEVSDWKSKSDTSDVSRPYNDEGADDNEFKSELQDNLLTLTSFDTIAFEEDRFKENYSRYTSTIQSTEMVSDSIALSHESITSENIDHDTMVEHIDSESTRYTCDQSMSSAQEGKLKVEELQTKSYKSDSLSYEQEQRMEIHNFDEAQLKQKVIDVYEDYPRDSNFAAVSQIITSEQFDSEQYELDENEMAMAAENKSSFTNEPHDSINNYHESAVINVIMERLSHELDVKKQQDLETPPCAFRIGQIEYEEIGYEEEKREFVDQEPIDLTGFSSETNSEATICDTSYIFKQEKLILETNKDSSVEDIEDVAHLGEPLYVISQGGNDELGKQFGIISKSEESVDRTESASIDSEDLSEPYGDQHEEMKEELQLCLDPVARHEPKKKKVPTATLR